jgi:hypothetical protein
VLHSAIEELDPRNADADLQAEPDDHDETLRELTAERLARREMAFDPTLAQRVRDILSAKPAVTERKMFGGLAFMIRGHMVVGISGSSMMARVGPDAYQQALTLPTVSPNVFGDGPTKGYVMVSPDGLSTDSLLRGWVELCCTFVSTLPDKTS